MESEPLLVNNADYEVTVRTTDEDEDVRKKKRNRRCLLALNIVTFFYFVGAYPMFTTTDQYAKLAISESFNLTNLVADRDACLHGNNTQYIDTQLKIQSKTSMVMILVNAAGLIPQFIITFLLGPCSDQIGRKIAFILPPVGGCLKAVIFLLIAHYNLHYYYLIVGSFVEGIFGAFPLFFTACIAYIADLTAVKDRSLWLCVIDVTIGLSIVITNVAGGYIITLLGFSWMFLLVAVTFSLCTLLILTLIRETVDIKKNVKVKIFTTLHMKRTLRVYMKDNGTNRKWKLLMLLVIVCLINLGSFENADASTFILLSYPVCFTPVLLGFYLAVLYVGKTIGGLALMKINHCGVNEGGLLLISIASYMAYEIVISFAYHIETLFIATLIACAQLLANPLARSLISPLGSPDEQGALFAAATWLQQLSVLLANMYQNSLYAATVSILRGLFLLVTASVNGLCLILVIVLLVLWRREDIKKSRQCGDDLGTDYGSIQDTAPNGQPAVSADNKNMPSI